VLEAGPKPAGNGTTEAGPASVGAAGGLQEFEQCGGAGGGCWATGGEAACKDARFADKGCASGLECVRQNFWYRQCLKAGVVKSLGSAWVTTEPAAKPECSKGFFGFQQQCGGKGGQCASNTMLGGCNDAAASGACCEPGTTCTKVSEYFWQCQGQPSSSSITN
jgi:hypothetical protein